MQGLTDRLWRTLETGAAIALGLMAALVIYQVGARYLFGSPPSWTEELARFLQVWLVLLASPICVRRGMHLAVDYVTPRLPPGAALALRTGVLLISALFCLGPGLLRSAAPRGGRLPDLAGPRDLDGLALPGGPGQRGPDGGGGGGPHRVRTSPGDRGRRSVIPALLITLALLLLLGVPVAFAIGLSGMAALVANGQIPFEIIPQRAFAALNSWALMAVPLFIFAGELMNACGISRRTVEVVGRLRGGLPIVSVVSSMFFASISGSSSASTAAVGSMMIPAMQERGYPTGFATALQAAGGALGPIIPPSIIMIVMGYVTETSIAALFVGGIVPGFLMAAALIGINLRRSRRYEAAFAASGNAPPPPDGSLARAVLGALPALGMPVVVLGGILAGIFTATEAAGVAVAYGLAVGFFVYRELRLRDLRPLLVSAALRSCVVLFVATSAFLLAWIIAVGRVPDQVGGQVEALAGGQLSFLIVCNIILIVVGMFMESISAIIVIMPILFPLALQLGIDPIHFGVLASVNLCIGMVTPPYGATLFVACTIAKRSISDIAGWTVRPVLAMVAVLVLMTVFPDAVTILPRWLGML